MRALHFPALQLTRPSSVGVQFDACTKRVSPARIECSVTKFHECNGSDAGVVVDALWTGTEIKGAKADEGDTAIRRFTTIEI